MQKYLTQSLRSPAPLVALSAVLLLAVQSIAAPRLPGFFSDNMVLQRDREIPVWGWAEPGEEITVTFAGQTVKTTASPEGKWSAKLAPLPAGSEPQTLSVASAAGEPAVVLNNIVVGDVWICSGQSNMEWTLNRAQDAKEEIAAADFPMIRHMKIGHVVADLPKDDVQSQWQVCTPGSAGGFTAVGYFFTR